MNKLKLKVSMWVHWSYVENISDLKINHNPKKIFAAPRFPHDWETQIIFSMFYYSKTILNRDLNEKT